ncbi:ribonuclease H-like domain-containing protein [Planctomycetota bacterium]
MKDCTDSILFPATVLAETFLHVPGVGPKTEAKMRAVGYETWQSVLQRPDDLPLGSRTSQTLLEALACSLKALLQEDIAYFINCFPTKEQWRILAAYFDRLSYFDIETSGLSYDAYVTCIVCYHKGQLHRFVHGENLDDFLDLLEEIELLVSFNGASFDIPQLLQTWHIPEWPCPHIDLRWQCYHHNWEGGLKQIERDLGIQRPAGLKEVDGAEAVWLWYRWQQSQDQEARDKLLHYCAADVLNLQLVTAALLGEKSVPVTAPAQEELWSLLSP